MKVLIVNTLCGTGSTGRIVSDLYSILSGNGHVVKVAYGHGTPTRVPLEDTFKVNGKIGYYIHNAISRFTDRAGFYSTIHTYRFIQYIKRYKPDLIHLHNLHGYWINIEILFKFLKKYDKPIIWTLHDCWSFTGHCSHYSYNGCEKWKEECCSCKYLDIYPKSYFIDQSRKNYNDKKRLFTSISKMHIVTPSKWLANEVKESFFKKYPVTSIPNGIDLNIFKPTTSNIRKRLGVENNIKMLLAVSFVWNKEKGLDDIISLNERLNHKEYRIVIVGLTADQQKALPDSIIGLQRTSLLDELVELYTAADLLLNLSYQETMGMVTAEALACGTPAIVYNKTAVPEVVDEKTGVVVETGDIQTILDNINNAISLSKNDCLFRAEKFEREKQYEIYYKLYNIMIYE